MNFINKYWKVLIVIGIVLILVIIVILFILLVSKNNYNNNNNNLVLSSQDFNTRPKIINGINFNGKGVISNTPIKFKNYKNIEIAIDIFGYKKDDNNILFKPKMWNRKTNIVGANSNIPWNWNWKYNDSDKNDILVAYQWSDETPQSFGFAISAINQHIYVIGGEMDNKNQNKQPQFKWVADFATIYKIDIIFSK